MQDLYLAIDVGTGSVRAGLVGADGRVLALAAREHEQITPRYGWAEQRPDGWWAGAVATVREVLGRIEGAPARVGAVCACGQMHGTVLIDGAGDLVRETAILWNDKRAGPQVQAYKDAHDANEALRRTANPALVAWPGFKLAWLRDEEPETYARTAAVLMPKDYVNFRLTGRRATDWSEASLSFLMGAGTRDWSDVMIERLGLDRAKLPPILPPASILGGVAGDAASATGLRVGTPVLVGAGDFPTALLGSGVCRPGLASDVTGTSSIVTLIAERPLLAPEISNLATVEGNWGGFVLLDAGGDSVRWARRAFHANALGYDAIAEAAKEASAGADGLFFLPYLSGERLGAAPNSRAQFFGLTARHGLSHLHRAVMEGVAFAVRRHVAAMRDAGAAPERMIATGGGAKSDLWLKIKASLYDVPLVVPEEPEGGIVGCAALAAVATGRFAAPGAAADALVRHGPTIAPDPAWRERYAQMAPIFERLHETAQGFYDDLDALDGDDAG